KPFRLIERVALSISRKRRLDKLKHTVAANLKLGHIDSLELLELIKNDTRINSPVIFDIGSNIGTWTLLAKAVFPKATIHAFEPLKHHTAVFNENIRNLEEIYLHEYCIGNENASGMINISSFSDSSSLLEPTQLEYEYFNIKKIGEEKVTIKRLEDLIRENILPMPDVIKLDIQGFELEALKGMGALLRHVKYILCEVSFKKLYHNQALFLDIANYLESFNLYIAAFGNNTPVGAELTQIDVLFKS
ncbi:MAG TPA: FkbM family methyltransferase, partial [Candidatus Babeliaceae bacterium]|nr:FkbM family methyltransferase [Candidatus Babeliaceae bacterium]